MKTVHNEKNSKSEENRLNRTINLNDSFMSLEEEDDYDVDASDSKLTEFIRNAFFKKDKLDNGCSVCGKICKDVFTLQRHIAIVHEEKRYKCDECEALAAVKGVPETYNNIKFLYDQLQLDNIEHKLSEDPKLVNMTAGVGSSSSKFPCPYGYCYKSPTGEWIKGEDRTIENLIEHHLEWKNSGGKKDDLQNQNHGFSISNKLHIIMDHSEE